MTVFENLEDEPSWRAPDFHKLIAVVSDRTASVPHTIIIKRRWGSFTIDAKFFNKGYLKKAVELMSWLPLKPDVVLFLSQRSKYGLPSSKTNVPRTTLFFAPLQTCEQKPKTANWSGQSIDRQGSTAERCEFKWMLQRTLLFIDLCARSNKKLYEVTTVAEERGWIAVQLGQTVKTRLFQGADDLFTYWRACKGDMNQSIGPFHVNVCRDLKIFDVTSYPFLYYK